MMGAATRYVMLVSSLPALPPSPFAERQTPLSRLQLDRRLTLLEPEDAQQLALIEGVLHWEQLPMTYADADILRLAEATLARLPNGVLKELVLWRLELRTAVAALRRRRRGLPPPVPGEPWGHGRWVAYIRRHWSEPGFRLERVFPWIREANRLLGEGDSVGLERLLLGCVWDHAGRAGAGHHFGFEAVAVYVLKWNVIARWTRYNGAAAARRFEALMEAGLGEHGSLFR